MKAISEVTGVELRARGTRLVCLALAVVGLCLALGPGVAAASTKPYIVIGPIERDVAYAKVEAKVNPRGADTFVYAEWGTTPALGQRTSPVYVGSDYSYNIVSQTVGKLTGGTVYYVRMVAINRHGTSYSKMRGFTTLVRPLLCEACEIAP